MWRPGDTCRLGQLCLDKTGRTMAGILSSRDECNARSIEGQQARPCQKPDRERGHDTKPLALVMGVSWMKSKRRTRVRLFCLATELLALVRWSYEVTRASRARESRARCACHVFSRLLRSAS